MTDDNAPSRRRMLQLAGGVAAGALAGCTEVLPGTNQTSKPTSKPTVIEDTTFEGETIVVHLKDGTDADAIDLRSPEDKLLDTAKIGRKKTVEFSLYAETDMPLAPGKYTLVAVDKSGEEPQQLGSRTLDLTMSLSITDVRTKQTSGLNSPPDVQIKIKNTGELPAKIEYIGFPKGILSPDPAPSESDSPIETYEATSGGQIVAPGSKATFQSFDTPLRSSGKPKQGAVGVPKEGTTWEQLKANHCNGEQYSASLVVVPKYGDKHRRTVAFKYAGDVARRSAGPGYFCTDTSVTSAETNTTDTA